nr:hypothetical protein [Tanacetum cinerariifolium]
AFLRRSKASSGVTFRHFCSTTSEVNKKFEGDTPRQDHNKLAGDAIPDSAAAEKENQRRKGKQVAARRKVKLHIRVNDDADTGEDPKVAARFEDMKKEGTKAMNKGAFYTWLEALTKNLSTLPVPFSASENSCLI